MSEVPGMCINSTEFTGTYVKGLSLSVRSNSIKGYTLIELMLVIALLSLAAFLVIPRLPFTADYSLRADARKLAGIIRFLDDSATAKKEYLRLWFAPETDLIKVESSRDGLEFTEAASSNGYLLRDVRLSGKTDLVEVTVAGIGTVTDGEVAVVFNPSFGADPFTLLISGKGSDMRLSYNPFSGRVTLEEL